ncbi:unnamed protein product [Prunus brigantina]
MLSVHAAVHGPGGGPVLGSKMIRVLSRACRCVRISIWILFESRMEFAYCAISGFDMFGLSNRTQIQVWFSDIPKSLTLGLNKL